MVHIGWLWSFSLFVELSSKPGVGASGFPCFYLLKKPIGKWKAIRRRIAPLLSGWQAAGQKC
jgi:hypothetical protein